MRLLSVSPFLLPLLPPLVLYLFLGIHLLHFGFPLSFIVILCACHDSTVIFIAQSCRVLLKARIGKIVVCLWLWSQHSSRDLGDSARCQ